MKFRIAIGGVGPAALRARLLAAGVRLNAHAERLLADPRFPTAADPFPIALEVHAAGELGFPGGADVARLRAAAEARGLYLCPLETAPHLRLAFLDQAEGAADVPSLPHRAPPGSLTVFSPPLDDDADAPRGFYLRCIAGEPWLRGYCAPDDHLWSPEDRFVFRRGPSAPG